MGVVAADAEQFARWLGGELPTTRQWDKAIGRYERPRWPAPYLEPKTDKGVAVGLDGPMKRGAALQDRSRFGCRDMAGNGREWTSVISSNTEVQDVRVPNIGELKDGQLYVRGKMWSAKEPLSFRELESKQESKFILPLPGLPVDNTIGFRVVLELDR
jgi:formylglycine-generating enzyme required for sulfatase activity